MLKFLKRFGRRVYGIGVYTGPSPLALASPGDGRNPVLTHHDVTDAPGFFVADPFIIQVDGSWHMFFEAMIWRDDARVGVISHAESRDGRDWQYRRIVLSEPFHLSYPYVFAWNSDVYMIPETRQAGAVRLYRADPFPSRWVHVADLLRAPVLLDNSVFRHDDHWWMFADTSPGLAHDTLSLFHAKDLLGPWSPHPRNPLVAGDRRSARPGGRVVSVPGRLIRFAQDCHPDYGRCVRAFEIDRLDEREYHEQPHPGNPILAAGGERWNRGGMHHVDAQQLPDGSWMAAVDGWHRTVVRPGEIVMKLTGRVASQNEQS